MTGKRRHGQLQIHKRTSTRPMSSSKRNSSDVLRRIKAEARRLAEIDYQSNQSKNKSAFLSRMTSRHYARLLEKHYEDGEKLTGAMRSSNTRMSANNARLRSEIRNLNNDLRRTSSSRKFDERRHRRWLFLNASHKLAFQKIVTHTMNKVWFGCFTARDASRSVVWWCRVEQEWSQLRIRFKRDAFALPAIPSRLIL